MIIACHVLYVFLPHSRPRGVISTPVIRTFGRGTKFLGRGFKSPGSYQVGHWHCSTIRSTYTTCYIFSSFNTLRKTRTTQVLLCYKACQKNSLHECCPGRRNSFWIQHNLANFCNEGRWPPSLPLDSSSFLSLAAIDIPLVTTCSYCMWMWSCLINPES